VNGKSAPVLTAVGWPELRNLYRVDFRVPDATAAGATSLQITSAFIPSAEVKFAVQ
jgi:hypothetical protein